MTNRSQRTARKPTAGGPEADQLETLNAQMRGRRSSSEKIRRAIEGQIEAKSRRARREQTPASSAWKH